MILRPLRTALLALLLAAGAAGAQPAWLDRLDDSLFLESKTGFFRADLSGLVDLETYSIDQRPPGLIFGNGDDLFNPRLSLFLDTHLGPHLYSLVQARFDRGFDPGSRPNGDSRLDEYLLRYTPFDDARVNVQIGKFATVFGNWVPRHDSWSNPFITAPLPYENVTTITDHVAPGAPGGFLARRLLPDNKSAWLPMIWGPSYTSGASVFGEIQQLDYAFEVKNAALSSRPYAWDATRINWNNPTFTGRVGWRPGASWNIGSSVSYGTYLLPAAQTTLPAGTALRDYSQLTVGADVSYAWHHWQLWAEAMASRFQVPNVGNAETLAYYLEAKYKLTPRLFAAVRWNQQFFDTVPNGAGGFTRWDQDAWRMEGALGYRLSRHLQGKVQYSYSHQTGAFQQGEQLVATQVTLKF